jgi:transposase
MRRSFDGLAMIAESVMREDPLSGHLFVFRNRRGDRLKILYWDRDGYAIWYKRLEEGEFHIPQSPGEGKRLEIRAADLLALLEGLDLSTVKRRKRYKRKSMQKV